MDDLIVDPINSYVLLKRTKAVKNLLIWLTKNLGDPTRPSISGILIKENARTIAVTNGFVIIVVHLFNSLTDKKDQALTDGIYRLNGATKDLIILERVDVNADQFPDYLALFGRKSISYVKEHTFTRRFFNQVVDRNFDTFTIESHEKNRPFFLKLNSTDLPAGDYLAAIMPCTSMGENIMPEFLDKMGFGEEVIA